MMGDMFLSYLSPPPPAPLPHIKSRAVNPGKYDFTITVETDSVMKSFRIELDGFFVKLKLVLPNRDPCQHLR